MSNKGLVLGVYQGDNEDVVLTRATKGFNSTKADLTNLINVSGLAAKAKTGACRVFYGVDPEYSAVAVVCLGKQDAGYNEQEELNEARENVRVAVASAMKKITESGVKSVHIEPCGDAEAAAEAATMVLDIYDDLMTGDKRKKAPTVFCYTAHCQDAASVEASWQRGVILAEGQNLARRLKEAPANVMTPTKFCQIAQETAGKIPGISVSVHDKAWAEAKGMGCFLSVARGSDEPLRFLEVTYSGGKQGDAPFALVGKGITFDTGGISLKGPPKMDEMRADMGGGACTLASIYTAARLQLPINIKAFVPLTENMPSAHATKPGDVFTSMSGKTVQVDNTDAEGRLVLCDALTYAQTFQPSGIIDMATLTGAMGVALGSAATGVYSNSRALFDIIHKAGTQTGDRMWRMPLFNHYTASMTDAPLADLNNLSSVKPAGGSCTAAAFLREFVTHDKWMHLDIAGVMMNKSEVSYIPKGMSGRPTRTIVEFLNLLSKQQ